MSDKKTSALDEKQRRNAERSTQAYKVAQEEKRLKELNDAEEKRRQEREENERRAARRADAAQRDAAARARKEQQQQQQQQHQPKQKQKQWSNSKPKLTPLEINTRHKQQFFEKAFEKGIYLESYFNCSPHPAWFIDMPWQEIAEVTQMAFDRAMSRPRKDYTLCNLDILLSNLYSWFQNGICLKKVQIDDAMYRAYVNILGPDAFCYTNLVDPKWLLGNTDEEVRAYLQKVIPDNALLDPNGEKVVWPRDELELHLLDIFMNNTRRPYVTKPIASILRSGYQRHVQAQQKSAAAQEKENEYVRYY